MILVGKTDPFVRLCGDSFPLWCGFVNTRCSLSLSWLHFSPAIGVLLFSFLLMNLVSLLPLTVGLLVFCTFSACAKKEEAAHKQGQGHHVHVGLQGGTLVELGAHQYNLEFVRDAAAGSLTAYVLDGHAENYTRLSISGFTVVATVNGKSEALMMSAVANPMTGETVGDSAQFTANAEWLKRVGTFDAVIPAIDVRGAIFSQVNFTFSQAGSQ